DADGMTVEELGFAVTLDDAAVGELDDVEVFALALVNFLDASEERFRISCAAGGGITEGGVVGHRFGREVPHGGETRVIADDRAGEMKGDDAVGGGVERGLEQRDGVGELVGARLDLGLELIVLRAQAKLVLTDEPDLPAECAE